MLVDKLGTTTLTDAEKQLRYVPVPAPVPHADALTGATPTPPDVTTVAQNASLIPEDSLDNLIRTGLAVFTNNNTMLRDGLGSDDQQLLRETTVGRKST